VPLIRFGCSRRLEALIGFDDALHECMPDDIARRELRKRNSRHALQDLRRVFQA
jgi:hypothetical protein